MTAIVAVVLLVCGTVNDVELKSSYLRCIAVSSDIKQIATWDEKQNRIQIIDTDTNNLKGAFSWDPDWGFPKDGWFSHDRRLLFCKGGGLQKETTIRVFNIDDGSLKYNVRRMKIPLYYGVSPKSDIVTCVGGGHSDKLSEKVIFVHLNSNKSVVGKHRSRPECMTFTPDGKHCVCGHGHVGSSFKPNEHQVTVSDPFSGEINFELKGYDAKVNYIAFSPSGSIMGTASDDKIVLWDFKKRKIIGELNGHLDKVKALVFQDENSLISFGMDKHVIVWDLEKRSIRSKSKADFDLHDQSKLFLSPDGHLMAMQSFHRVRIWKTSK